LALFRRTVFLITLLCLGCAAQSNAPELNQRIEREVRTYFSIPPTVNLAVSPRKPSSEFPTYDTVTITFTQGERTQSHDFLLSKDGKTLVRVTKLDVSKDPYAEVMSKIDTKGRPMRGNKDAKVTIVNFDDLQCPFCSRMHSTLMHDVMKTYGDRVKVYYKDFPLSEIHPWATHAAVDANCLASLSNDSYWAYADVVHEKQKEITGSQRPQPEQFAALDKLAIELGQKNNLPLVALQSCIKAQSDAAVQASVKEATGLGVTATPTMFINGVKIDGYMPAEQVKAVIDRALADAGAGAPASAAAAPAAK